MQPLSHQAAVVVQNSPPVVQVGSWHVAVKTGRELRPGTLLLLILIVLPAARRGFGVAPMQQRVDKSVWSCHWVGASGLLAVYAASPTLMYLQPYFIVRSADERTLCVGQAPYYWRRKKCMYLVSHNSITASSTPQTCYECNVADNRPSRLYRRV